MLLSEAILLGSVGTGQAFNFYQTSNGNTCGMGAAMVAVGLKPEFYSIYKMYEIFPYLKKKVEGPSENAIDNYPAWGPTIQGWIVLLNNGYRWTRPQIAAWVAEKERELGIVDQVVQEAKDGEHACA